MWDEDTGKGTGKGASSSSCAAALAITNTMIKGKGKLNEQQKEAKKCKTVLTMVKTTIKDIDAALFNNGKVLKQKKNTNLLQHKQTLTAFFLKDTEDVGKHTEIQAAIKAAKQHI